MSTEPQDASASAQPESAAPAPLASAPANGAPTHQRRLLRITSGVALAALLVNGWLWLRMTDAREQFMHQSANADANASEARALVRQTQEQTRELAARLTLMDVKLGEVALQRTQLEELMQSLSRSRDENVLVDIESALRLAQQQAQMVGSIEPLLSALRGAEQRLQRLPQARLAPVQRALARDIARIKAQPVIDTPSLLARLDELMHLLDELPLANAVGPDATAPAAKPTPTPTPLPWWRQWLAALREETQTLVRVGRIDHPDAALLTPEQSFFIRENAKLLLLNTRLGLLAHQAEAARGDLGRAQGLLQKYFNTNARATRNALSLVQQLQGSMKNLETPRVDDTLAALTAAAASR